MVDLIPSRQLILSRVKLLCEDYPRFSALPDEKRSQIIRRIERSCMNNTVRTCNEDSIPTSWTDERFKGRYSATCYRVMVNLKHSDSAYLLDALIDGKIKPEAVAELASEDLNPEANASIREEIAIRQNQKIEEKFSKAYKCYKCGHGETKLRPYQGRAADEDSAMSIKCLGCGNVWRK